MTAFAGFYVTPDTWRAWVDSNPNRRPWAFGETAAQDLIIESLCKKKLGNHFYVQIVPVPPSEPDYGKNHFSIMLVRSKARKRAYIAQRPDSKCDLAGQKVIKKYIGLEVSVWKTLWFDEESSELPYEAEFLEPVASEERGNAKKRGNGKNKATRQGTASSDEGGDVSEKGRKESEGTQVKDGKVEGQEMEP